MAFSFSFQPQPAVDNCPAHVSAGTDDAIVAKTDDTIVASADDAIVASVDVVLDANTAEVAEEVKGQDSVAWRRHAMETVSTLHIPWPPFTNMV